LGKLTESHEGDLSVKVSRADEKTSPELSRKEKEFIQGSIFPEGRNFR
jgi:hypothetical protein